jgi:hypothetical protein
MEEDIGGSRHDGASRNGEMNAHGSRIGVPTRLLITGSV